MSTTRMILLIIILAVFFSCSKQAKQSKRVKVTFTSLERKNVFKTNKWGEAVPTSSAQVECVAVFVTYQSAVNNNTCTDSSNVVQANPDEMFGTRAYGESFSTEVKSGYSTRFQLVGFKKSIGEVCPILGFNDNVSLSAPILLGENTAFIDGDAIIELTGTVSSAPTLTSCTGDLFNWVSTTTSLWDVATWDVSTWGP